MGVVSTEEDRSRKKKIDSYLGRNREVFQELAQDRKALIGNTGFVGSNILKQTSFDDLYNSTNIEHIQGKTYDLLICAGAPASKWIANKNPGEDLATINRLIACLGHVKVKTFVLISTIDVYPKPIEVDEATVIDKTAGQPYGHHRLHLEQYVAENFASTIIRLPGLFGHGLKKNVIYDFLHNHEVNKIHQNGVFQFYFLGHLWKDIQIVLRNNIHLINFATEPISVKEVATKVFDIEFNNNLQSSAPKYDMRSRHAGLWNGKDGYLYNKECALRDLRNYVHSMK